MNDPQRSVADFVIETSFATLPELLRQHARVQPSHIALIQDDRDDGRGLRQVDYATLDERMDAIAARLQQEGVRMGDSVAVCAPNSIEYAMLFLGALRAGAV